MVAILRRYLSRFYVRVYSTEPPEIPVERLGYFFYVTLMKISVFCLIQLCIVNLYDTFVVSNLDSGGLTNGKVIILFQTVNVYFE